MGFQLPEIVSDFFILIFFALVAKLAGTICYIHWLIHFKDGNSRRKWKNINHCGISSNFAEYFWFKQENYWGFSLSYSYG